MAGSSRVVRTVIRFPARKIPGYEWRFFEDIKNRVRAIRYPGSRLFNDNLATYERRGRDEKVYAFKSRSWVAEFYKARPTLASKDGVKQRFKAPKRRQHFLLKKYPKQTANASR